MYGVACILRNILYNIYTCDYILYCIKLFTLKYHVHVYVMVKSKRVDKTYVRGVVIR